LVALSGGRITKKLFGEVVRLGMADLKTLECVHFFWADERCVPPGDPESNYYLAKELLFEPLHISACRIHRIQGEVLPELSAEQASKELRQVANAGDGVLPILDLVLLGMGEDAHVASLFPGDTSSENDQTSVFLPIHNSPKPPPERISLGHGMIAVARKVWVLASGKGKQAALKQSLAPDGLAPLARVIQKRTVCQIFTDISLN